MTCWRSPGPAPAASAGGAPQFGGRRATVCRGRRCGRRSPGIVAPQQRPGRGARRRSGAGLKSNTLSPIWLEPNSRWAARGRWMPRNRGVILECRRLDQPHTVQTLAESVRYDSLSVHRLSARPWGAGHRRAPHRRHRLGGAPRGALPLQPLARQLRSRGSDSSATATAQVAPAPGRPLMRCDPAHGESGHGWMLPGAVMWGEVRS